MTHSNYSSWAASAADFSSINLLRLLEGHGFWWQDAGYLFWDEALDQPWIVITRYLIALAGLPLVLLLVRLNFRVVHVKQDRPTGGRTTDQELAEGPTNLLFERDLNGMPVMSSVRELTARYGRGADSKSALLRDEHNVLISMAVAGVCYWFTSWSLRPLDRFLHLSTIPLAITAGGIYLLLHAHKPGKLDGGSRYLLRMALATAISVQLFVFLILQVDYGHLRAISPWFALLREPVSRFGSIFYLLLITSIGLITAVLRGDSRILGKSIREWSGPISLMIALSFMMILFPLNKADFLGHTTSQVIPLSDIDEIDALISRAIQHAGVSRNLQSTCFRHSSKDEPSYLVAYGRWITPTLPLKVIYIDVSSHSSPLVQIGIASHHCTSNQSSLQLCFPDVTPGTVGLPCDITIADETRARLRRSP